MNNSFFVTGEIDKTIKVATGPLTMEEAIEIEKEKRKKYPDLFVTIRHKSSMKDK